MGEYNLPRLCVFSRNPSNYSYGKSVDPRVVMTRICRFYLGTKRFDSSPKLKLYLQWQAGGSPGHQSVNLQS
jgi:hypothetical protein